MVDFHAVQSPLCSCFYSFIFYLGIGTKVVNAKSHLNCFGK